MEFAEELHPDWYHDIPVMDVLILGSFPPYRGRHTYPFYYPNQQNRFWRILAHIAGTPLGPAKENPEMAIRERKAIMEKLRVGIHNMGHTIRRRGTGSLDTDIEIIRFQDILGIIRRHPELRRILLPGYSAKNSTFRAFLRYLAEQGIAHPVLKPVPETVFTIHVDGRAIECVVLNSTSPAVAIPERVIREQFERWVLLR